MKYRARVPTSASFPTSPDPAVSSAVSIGRAHDTDRGLRRAPSSPGSPQEISSPGELPLPPTSPPQAGHWRATLTVLTGPQAGQVLVIGEASITIGRVADAGFVLDDPGVGDHHARVTRTPCGDFAILDLASTNGTFLGARRVGVALLRGGDLLRFGPSAQLRFAIINSIEDP
jgi:hypothetical protein